MIGWIVTILKSGPARKALGLFLAITTVALFLLNLRRAGERTGRLAERLSTSEKAHETQRRCWTPPVAAQLIAMIWLSACAMGGSDERGQACPPAVDYNRSDQSRLADEISALADTSMIVRVLKDYAVLRDQARNCDAG